MSDSESDLDGAVGEIGGWDPDTVRRALGKLRPLLKRWFRAEVRGLDRVPSTGALIVSNHSGDPWALDTPLFALDYCDKFGYDRPIYTLSHDVLLSLMKGQFGDTLRRSGMIRATRANAVAALRSGGLVVVFPGGDYDVFRPTSVLRQKFVT